MEHTESKPAPNLPNHFKQILQSEMDRCEKQIQSQNSQILTYGTSINENPPETTFKFEVAQAACALQITRDVNLEENKDPYICIYNRIGELMNAISKDLATFVHDQTERGFQSSIR